MKKFIKIFTLFIILAGIVIGGYYYWQHGKYFPSTDDAYVQANVVNIAPQVTGQVFQIYITNNQYVKKGQALLDIDPTPFQIAVSKAKADLENTISQVQSLEAEVSSAQAMLEERQAELTNIIKNTQRIMALVKQHLYAVASGDKATSQLKVAQAQVVAAKSQLREAKKRLGDPGKNNARILAAQANLANTQLQLQYTHIKAPISGYVINLSLRQGSEISAYQQLFAIIDNSQWWATANFRETDLDRIRVGQKATIKVDMYPNHEFKGIVQSISRGSGASFALLPPEDATGNWVKVTQRFPVRVTILSLDPNYPLRMGASCTVIINTR